MEERGFRGSSALPAVGQSARVRIENEQEEEREGEWRHTCRRRREGRDWPEDVRA